MKREEYLLLLQNPAGIDAQPDLLKEMVVRFPYCQTSQVLYAIQLAKAGSLEFNHQLRRAAAYSSNRKKLRYFISLIQRQEEPILEISMENIVESVIPDPQKQESAVTGIIEDESKPSANTTSYRMSLLDIVNKRLAEIEKEHQEAKVQQTEDQSENVPVKLDDDQEDQKTGLTREEIIEKFMREEPRISKPKSDFFSPSEKAFKSGIDDDEIVSETLAQLYYQQGNIQKAKRIYEKLSLLFPEKSSYFAALIEKPG